MKFVITLLIPLFLEAVGISPDGESVVLSPDEQGFIVPGIHKEFLPQPIFYESYIPLILEYVTPKWNKTEITFNNWYTCVTETFPYKYSCPVIYHMNQAIGNLHVDFEGLHPAVDTETIQSEETTRMYFDRLITSSEFCSKIQKHFSSIYTNASVFETYLIALKSCRMEWAWDSSEGDENLMLIQRNMSDFNYAIRLPFARMENNFYNTFYKNITAPELTTLTPSDTAPTSATLTPKNTKFDMVASALLSNARSTYQAGILGVYYAEKNRWVHATSDCLQGRIPQSIVTKSKFVEGLNNITKLKAFQSLELSVDANLVSKYYSLPITDCSHTSKNTLVVRVQVPFLKKNRSKSLQLVLSHTLPFEYKGHVCKIKLSSQTDHSPSGFFQQVHGSHFLYEELSGLAFPTDCKGNELCKISEYGLNTRSGADRCASALMNRNYSVIRNHCQFQCRKQDLSEAPLVTRIHSNQYILTGSPLTIVIHCKTTSSVGNSTSTQQTQGHFEYFIESPRIGAHLVNLPCNCLFTLKDTDKLRNVQFSGGGCSTPDSGSESMTFTTPNLVPIIPFHFARAKESHNTVGSFYYENLSPEAKVNLADFLDEERLEAYLLNRVGDFSGGNRRGGGSYPVVEGREDITKVLLDETCSSIIVLWSVFIITTVVIISFQCYILFIVKKNERVSYQKDERILYKVPDSPEM